jgi:hypothetical protein
LTADAALAICVHVAVGVWLVMSAIAKLDDTASAIAATGRYWLIPGGLEAPATAAIILIESILGVALVTGLLWPWSTILSAVLLITYAIAMSVDLVRGDVHACGCGPSQKPIGWLAVGRNLIASLALALTIPSGDGIPVLVHSALALTIIGASIAIVDVTHALREWRGTPANG